MEVDLALLADAATVDAAGKLNILGIFDRISASLFPAQHPHVSLVLRFSASLTEAGGHKVAITLTDPDGGEVLRLDGDIHVGPGPAATGGRVRVPQVVNMERLVFNRPGRYSFDVSVDGIHQITTSLFLHAPAAGQKPAQA